jgi:DNA polymerase-3 subunit gamma/tau
VAEKEKLALYRLWRPQTFDEVVSQKQVVYPLQQSVVEGTFSHALLFSGTRGTGKTSLAKIFAKAINCLSPHDGNPCNACDICREINNGALMDINEIDAASNNSVEHVRRLTDEIIFTPVRARYKVYIIDEAHMLSTGAFNALLKTLEEPPEHAVFVLATTEPHRIPATIISRCQHYKFRRIPNEAIATRLSLIARDIDLEITDDALESIAHLSAGALRDAISLLDQSRQIAKRPVERDDVLEIAGRVPDEFLSETTASILFKNQELLLVNIQNLVLSGRDFTRFVTDLGAYFRNLLVCKVSKTPEKLILLRDQDIDTLRAVAEKASTSAITSIIEGLAELLVSMRFTPDLRTTLEIGLLRLASKYGNPRDQIDVEIEDDLDDGVAVDIGVDAAVKRCAAVDVVADAAVERIAAVDASAGTAVVRGTAVDSVADAAVERAATVKTFADVDVGASIDVSANANADKNGTMTPQDKASVRTESETLASAISSNEDFLEMPKNSKTPVFANANKPFDIEKKDSPSSSVLKDKNAASMTFAGPLSADDQQEGATASDTLVEDSNAASPPPKDVITTHRGTESLITVWSSVLESLQQERRVEVALCARPAQVSLSDNVLNIHFRKNLTGQYACLSDDNNRHEIERLLTKRIGRPIQCTVTIGSTASKNDQVSAEQNWLSKLRDKVAPINDVPTPDPAHHDMTISQSDSKNSGKAELRPHTDSVNDRFDKANDTLKQISIEGSLLLNEHGKAHKATRQSDSNDNERNEKLKRIIDSNDSKTHKKVGELADSGVGAEEEKIGRSVDSIDSARVANVEKLADSGDDTEEEKIGRSVDSIDRKEDTKALGFVDSYDSKEETEIDGFADLSESARTTEVDGFADSSNSARDAEFGELTDSKNRREDVSVHDQLDFENSDLNDYSKQNSASIDAAHPFPIEKNAELSRFSKKEIASDDILQDSTSNEQPWLIQLRQKLATINEKSSEANHQEKNLILPHKQLEMRPATLSPTLRKNMPPREDSRRAGNILSPSEEGEIPSTDESYYRHISPHIPSGGDMPHFDEQDVPPLTDEDAPYI